jgi:outer membrane protein TolC
MSASRLAATLLQSFFIVVLIVIATRAVYSQQPPTPSVTPTQSTNPPSPPQTNPTPPANPSATPAALPPSSPSASPTASQTTAPTTQANNSIALDEAVRLANAQVSGLQQARLNERIAAEDVRQAQAAFLPKVSSPLAYIYTTPAIGQPPGEPRVQSFIANNAIGEYQAFANVAGDLDIFNGKLRATLERNRALLDAARAGTQIARRALEQATVEAYYGLALAAAQRQSAEQNVSAAEEFERITSLLLSGGEVAPVDQIRARLQTLQRRDELERARANEAVAADALRVLVGYASTRPISATDLTLLVPADGEVERITSDAISRRPEFAQFDAERRVAQQEARAARAERRPQLSYSISGGFDTDSWRPPRLKEHTGFSAAFNLSIPIFDWGVSRSREAQAQLRLQITENERTQALRGFNQQFSSARTQALSAATRVRLAASTITLAQNNLDASIARYRAGEAQIIEVTDAETTLAAQRLAFYQALYDYQVALTRLRQAAGQ